MRGRHVHNKHEQFHAGLIPAGAGADVGIDQIITSDIGSSPRVRGRPNFSSASYFCFGLISAGAGQTACYQREFAGYRAHPRGCGADRSTSPTSWKPIGSSPRVRGRRGEVGVDVVHVGLIPAGAGQTSNKWVTFDARTAHPRGCGADIGDIKRRWPDVGSSPRVRGRRRSDQAVDATGRLIPAGAGQTGAGVVSDSGSGAHPHGCGADRTKHRPNGSTSGSSPRVRGRPDDDQLGVRVSGLIPAGARQTVRWTSK